MAEWNQWELRGSQKDQTYLQMNKVHSIGSCCIGKLETFIVGNVGIRRVCNGCLEYLVKALELRIMHSILIKYWHQGWISALAYRRGDLKFKNDI
jgi:hypothetical protein